MAPRPRGGADQPQRLPLDAGGRNLPGPFLLSCRKSWKAPAAAGADLGVAQVSLLGTASEEIQVLFDPDHLNELGLTPVILQQLISYQNIVVPGGAVTADGVRYITRAGSMINSIEELENIIVGMKQGSGILGLGGLVPSLIYLSDVAEVSTRVAPREGITRYNGQDTVLIQVMRQSGRTRSGWPKGSRTPSGR